MYPSYSVSEKDERKLKCMLDASKIEVPAGTMPDMNADLAGCLAFVSSGTLISLLCSGGCHQVDLG